jgi:geranylgeranyl diphosphate synthase type II
VLLGHLLRTIKGKDKKKLIKIMEKKREDKTQKEVDWVIKQMDTLGSIDYARDLASHYKDIAMEMFEGDLKFLSKQPARDEMETLIHFILERDH